MQNARTSRLYWLDLLRVLAAFTVVGLHASASFVKLYRPNPGWNWWVANLVDASSRWCVPIFVMLSGSLFLSKPIAGSPLPFYRRYLGRLLILLLIWTGFYLTVQAFRDRAINLQAFLTAVYTGVPYYHLWYFYMLIGLYLVAPFINRFVWTNSRRWLEWAIVLSFLLAMIYTLTPVFIPSGEGIFLTIFPPYIAYFLAGHYLTSSDKSFLPPQAALALAVACGAANALLTGILASFWGEHAWSLTYSYFNPLVILMSLCVFSFIKSAFADKATPRSWVARFITWLAPLTLGIYVIHPLWLGLFQSLPIAVNEVSATGILFSTLAAFLISTGVTVVLRKIPWVQSAVR